MRFICSICSLHTLPPYAGPFTELFPGFAPDNQKLYGLKHCTVCIIVHGKATGQISPKQNHSQSNRPKNIFICVCRVHVYQATFAMCIKPLAIVNVHNSCITFITCSMISEVNVFSFYNYQKSNLKNFTIP